MIVISILNLPHLYALVLLLLQVLVLGALRRSCNLQPRLVIYRWGLRDRQRHRSASIAIEDAIRTSVPLADDTARNIHSSL
jgi:hypothetical protein